MIISGIQKTSLIDYPRKICTVLFTRGCNFFCGFCHNPELVLPQKFRARIPLYKIFAHLKKLRGKIEGVVITGGEPTIHKDLPDFIKKIKRLGYAVKLDTNGTNPKMLQKLINQKLIDYVAMDIKGPLEKYHTITGRRINIDKIKESVKIIKQLSLNPSTLSKVEGRNYPHQSASIQYEFRTTVVPTLHEKSDFIKIAKWLSGTNKYYLQKFRPALTLNQHLQKIKPFTEKEMQEFKRILQKRIKKVIIR